MTASEPARTRRNVGSTLADFLLGPPFARRFALAHAVDDLGDAIVNLSLVNSLFLSVSLDASRQRILLYLVLTAAPLVFIAPLIGSVLDRTRFGYRIAISGSQALRAVVAVALIGSLLSIALYPLTFVLLVARKAYGLAKSALLSQMTTDPQELLSSDTHIGRTGTMAAGVGTALGGLLLIGGYTTAMLLIAAVAFLVAAVISSGLPHPNQAVRLKSVPRLSEAIPAGILSATIAATAVRAAAGALTYLLAFAIKRGGGDAWIFTAGLFAAGAGGLIANLTATRLHRRLDCDWVLVLSLMVPGLVCALGVATVGQFGVLAIAFSIGLGRSVATRALAVLNASVPLLARARSVARTELVFQVATLVGAILAVQLAPTPSTGFAVSSLALLAAGTAFGFRHRNSLRQQARPRSARRGCADDRPEPARCVARRGTPARHPRCLSDGGRRHRLGDRHRRRTGTGLARTRFVPSVDRARQSDRPRAIRRRTAARVARARCPALGRRADPRRPAGHRRTCRVPVGLSLSCPPSGNVRSRLRGRRFRQAPGLVSIGEVEHPAHLARRRLDHVGFDRRRGPVVVDRTQREEQAAVSDPVVGQRLGAIVDEANVGELL